jgi:hypothetical protein
MGLLTTITSWFSGGGTSAGTVFVVDGVGLIHTRAGFRPGPRDMLTLLGRLGRFAAHEKVGMVCAFEGDPLHRAADGDELQGVTVHYSKTTPQHATRMVELARMYRTRARLVVVTSDPAVERQVASLGARLMRCATFRKALEGAEGEPESSGAPSGGGPRRRFNRRPRGGRGVGPRPPAPAGNAGSAPNAGPAPAPPAPSARPAPPPAAEGIG